jgi:HEAT repeat protein
MLQRKDVIADLARDLGGARSKEAAEALVGIGDAAVDELARAASDSESHRRRWAAIDALKALKREDRVDLGAAYIADQSSRDCNTVTRAARKHGDLDDKRAIAQLREISPRKTLFRDACEASAARAALKKMERK